MFNKLLIEKLRNTFTPKSHQASDSVYGKVPDLNLDTEDQEEDGFLLVGQTPRERETFDSSLDYDPPPSYDSQVALPSYECVTMGGRHSKKEIFEPTLHAAGRQSSVNGASTAEQQQVHNDVLTPYFQSLQQRETDKQVKDCSVEAVTATLCTTASPADGAGATAGQAQVHNTGANAMHLHQQVLQPAATSPYDDIPFKLSSSLVAGNLANDVNHLSKHIVNAHNSCSHRYNYDFQLERGVVRAVDQ